MSRFGRGFIVFEVHGIRAVRQVRIKELGQWV